ncbi:MAG: hydroxymethylglutaryl-CoA synthase [Candidatus Anstonellales archaeon]
MAGICSYGAYVPKYRIKVEEIANVWGEEGERIKNGLGLIEKSVPGMDEDTVTMAVESSRIALERYELAFKEEIKASAIFVGSESHPYAVKPSATIVQEALGFSPSVYSADLEFACKAGTTALIIINSMVDSNKIDFGIAIGSDTSQGRPMDALEYSAGAGAASFVLGKKNTIADIIDHYSFSTDTPDFWRRQHVEFPSHGGRFTGQPAYFRHVLSATKKLLEKTKTTVNDYDYFVFHQPNGKFPLLAAKQLGIPKEKIELGLLTPQIGNTYSGASMIGLANVLDNCKGNEKIFVCSFGSGAGSDAFILEVKDNIKRFRETEKEHHRLEYYVKRKKYLTYGMYAKHRGKLKGLED